MATLDSLQVAIGATIEETGFQRAEAAIGGLGTAAQAAAVTASSALGQIGAAVDGAAGRYVDAQGRLRSANGQFVTSAQQAAEAAARNGGSLGSLGDIAGTTARTINGQLVQSLKEYDKALKPLEAGIGRVGQGAKSLGQDLTIGVTLPIIAGGAAALAAAGKYEALGKGLTAVTQQQLADQGVSGLAAVSQAATQTAQDLLDLKEIAKAPGIGFEQAVQGAVRLEVVGESASEAKNALREFANAIALTGGGAQNLDLVTTQLAQLAAKGKVLSQDLRPIIEAAPAVASALQKIFGSIDPEEISAQLEKAGKSSRDFINDLVGELGKLPRVTGGLSNSFENFTQTAEQSLGKVGDAISKALDLPALLESISNSVEAAADSFAALDPSAQTLIVSLALTAAAVGPVLVAVGGILAIVPQVVAGFGLVSAALSGSGAAALAFATGPVGIALAAVVALGGGLYYLATAGDRAVQSYRDQAKATDQATAAVAPLLARYTELSEKVTRSEAEQTELNAVIQQLADLVPGAVTAIDQYGKATGISTKAVTDFTAALQQQKQAQAALALPDAEVKLNRLKTTYESLKAAADQYNKTGTITSSGPALGPGGGSIVATYKANGEAVAKLQLQLANANVEFQKQKGLVEELRGSTKELTEQDASLANALNSVGLAGAAATGGLLAGLRERLKELKEARENATTTSGTLAFNPLIDAVEKQIAQLEGTSKRGKDALADLQKALADNGRQSTALGADYDYLGNQQKLIESGIKSLITAGYDPAGKTVQRYVAQLRELNQVLGDNAQLSLKALKGSENLFKTPDFELKLPDKVEVPEVLLPDYATIFRVAAADIAAGSGGIEQQFTTFTQAQADFNTRMGELLDQFPAEAFAQIGAGIGQALASGGDVLAAAGAEILKAAASFMAEYGRIVILKGVADIAIGNIGQGIAEVAAGTALTALGGLASGIASGIGKGGSSLASQPNANYGGSAANNASGKLLIEVKLGLRGQDLVAVQKAQVYRVQRTN